MKRGWILIIASVVMLAIGLYFGLPIIAKDDLRWIACKYYHPCYKTKLEDGRCKLEKLKS